MSLEEREFNLEFAEAERQNVKSFIISQSSGIVFALHLDETRGVSTIGRIIPTPGTAPSITGLTYFRGGIEAAVNLGEIWKTKSSEKPGGHAILVEAGGRRAVLIVEDLIDLFDSNSELENLGEAGKELIGQVGSIQFNGRKIPVISALLLLQSIA